MIFVDDGSKDDSVTVLRKAVDAYDNIYLFEQENSGVSIARNAGLYKAKGKYIWFVDADDYISVNCFNWLYEYLKKAYDVVSFSYEDVTEDLVLPFELTGLKTTVNRNVKLQSSVCSNIYKKTVVTGNGIVFPEQIHIGEDKAFNTWVELNAATQLVIKAPIYKRRLSDQSLTRSQNQQSRIRHFESAYKLINFYNQLSCSAKNVEYKEKTHKLSTAYCILSCDLLFTISDRDYISKSIDIMSKYRKRILTDRNTSTRRRIVNSIGLLLPFKIWFWIMWYLHRKKRN